VLPKVRLNLGLLGKKLIILQSVIRIEGIKFAGVLGYEFRGIKDTSLGKRMHVDGYYYTKYKLEPLYDDHDFIPGRTKGLKLLYTILLYLFHENIVPNSSNEDEIQGALDNLLLYFYRIYRKGEDGPPMPPIGFIHFIYQEMYLCM
jgi:hypothetical protein